MGGAGNCKDSRVNLAYLAQMETGIYYLRITRMHVTTRGCVSLTCYNRYNRESG